MNSTSWGILGTGTMADLFVQALLSVPGAKVQAVASRHLDRAKAFAARYKIPVAVAGVESLLQEAAIEVVYICSANEDHFEHCLKVIAAGKAVLCEKPFTLTAAEARQVITSARSHGVFCMEAMWMRFAPAVREALQIAKEGRLGDLRFLSGQLGFPYAVDKESRLFRQPGGGALLDLGVYPLSLAQALFGPPIRLTSSAVFASTGVDEQFVAILNYENQAQAVITASLKTTLGNSASIHGQNGVLYLEEPLYFPEKYRFRQTPLHNPTLRSSHKLAKFSRYPFLRTVADLHRKAALKSVDKRTSKSGYAFEAAEVQRCLHADLKESPEMTLDDTLAVLECMDSIRSQWVS